MVKVVCQPRNILLSWMERYRYLVVFPPHLFGPLLEVCHFLQYSALLHGHFKGVKDG